MIQIGLTGWGDHRDLYQHGVAAKDKLKVYSAHFPIVEVDSSFYAIQPKSNYIKWINETPDKFSFIIKAYQGLTGHARGDLLYNNLGEMFHAFKESIQPVIEAGKLKAVLFQYPPWFECMKENVDLLRYTKEKMAGIPVALEFRHQSWFTPQMREKTLRFMESEGWIHSICDEPQAGIGSVPTVLYSTHPELTLIRFHGRNREGWNYKGESNWRDVRYLYCYSHEELLEWKEKIGILQKSTREICLLFNNNSGGHAAMNAKEMMKILGIDYDGLSPLQMDLFGDHF